jgi:hypothetical protein
MVKVNLTIRVPAETRQFIEELSKRYGMGMGDIVTFVFNEFKSEIIKRLEEKKGVFRSQSSEPRGTEGDILSQLMDMEAQPATEEDYYLRQLIDSQSNNIVW